MSDDTTTAAIDRLNAQVAELTRRLDMATAPPKPRHANTDHLTAADVHGAKFTYSRLVPGYVTEEVDLFLEQVAYTIESLTGELAEARAQLAALQGGGSTA